MWNNDWELHKGKIITKNKLRDLDIVKKLIAIERFS